MLSKTLIAAVGHIDDEAWLTAHLSPLGALHVEYGGTPVMYDGMGEHDQARQWAFALIAMAVRSGER